MLYKEELYIFYNQLTDEKVSFKFICVDDIKKRRNSFFAELVPSLSLKPHQYHAVVEFQFADNQTKDGAVDAGIVLGNQTENQLFIETLENCTLGELLQRTNPIDVEIYVKEHLLETRRKVIIKDIPLFRHYDRSDESSFRNETAWFLYGNMDAVHITCLAHHRGFIQVYVLIIFLK